MSTARALVCAHTLLLSVACLAAQQHVCVSQGRISLENCTCCYTEIEVVDQILYLTRSLYTDTGPIGPSVDPLRGDAVAETKTTLIVVRTREKQVIIYWKIERATLCSLPRTQVANFILKGTTFCSYVSAITLSTTNYRVHP